MTITSARVFPRINEHGSDRRPGTNDVAWAERAYGQKWDPSHGRREPRVRPRRVRALLVVLALILSLAGLVVAMRFSSSPAATVTRQPTSSQTTTVLGTSVRGLAFSGTPLFSTPGTTYTTPKK
jgi:hypothetical protein